MGACVSEIGMVRIQRGQITDRYQRLMNAGVRIPRIIEEFTGITNGMIRSAPKDRFARSVQNSTRDDHTNRHVPSVALG